MGHRRTSQGRPHLSKHRPRACSGRILPNQAFVPDTVCRLAGSANLIGSCSGRLSQAILDHDTPYLFEHLVRSFSLQGISDRAAWTYMESHGQPRWHDLQRATLQSPACPKLHTYWSFQGCGYRKALKTCAEPSTLSKCSLPRHEFRNGRLNQTAYSLYLFIRDVAAGDLVEWINYSLGAASSGSSRHRGHRMRVALIEPLRNVYGVSDKLLNMALADILLAAPPGNPLWLETGSNTVAIDTLVHNFLARTGLLLELGVVHSYGPACYSERGCSDVIGRIATRIDASKINSAYPRFFPRFVQHAIWRYCAQSELNICNGNNIDDRSRCQNKDCPLSSGCERLALHWMRT